MAATRNYWNQLKSVRDQIAYNMGVDASTTTKEVASYVECDSCMRRHSCQDSFR
jgi:hypothetical protein